jgi:protein-S-isoprenylcysteine O-methyltransferase Ste14
LRSRGLALGVLLLASLLSAAAVLSLRGCLGEARLTPCTRAPFQVCRHPISLSIVLLAAALTWLLPSLPGLVGSMWLAFHLDGQLSAEEVVLRARFGAGWVAYAAEVPRWPGVYVSGCLLLACAGCACCGWICERIASTRGTGRGELIFPMFSSWR